MSNKYYDPEYDRVVSEDVVRKQFEWFDKQPWFDKDYEDFKRHNFIPLKEYEVRFLFDGICARTTIEATCEADVEKALVKKMEKAGWNTAKEWQITSISEKCLNE